MPPPQPQQAKATLRWLATDGAPLLRFHRTAVEWRPGRTRAECKRIGDQLDRIGTPEQIMLTIAGVEDEPLQSMLNAEVRSLAEAVTNCANGSSTTPAAGLLPLAELTALVEQRLRALRAVR